MKKYIVNRILSVIPVLVIVSIVVFSLLHLTPGDPAIAILGEDATQEAIDELRERMGLNDPIPVQYLNWLSDIFHGDFGTSTASSGEAVTSMIASHFIPTLQLAVYSTIVTVLMAVPLGMLAARKRGTVVDHGVTVLALCGISLPSFLFGLGMMMLFAVKLRLVPVSGYKPMSAGLGAHFRTMIIPAVSLGFMHSAFMMRMTRASMLEVLNSDYIKMAKSKGVKELWLVAKHALRNSLVTLVTVIGQGFIGALSGATIVESMFGIPGMGSLVVNSIGRRDFQVIQAVVLLIAVINVVMNLVIDILYGIVDPRIRLS